MKYDQVKFWMVAAYNIGLPFRYFKCHCSKMALFTRIIGEKRGKTQSRICQYLQLIVSHLLNT